MSPGREKDRGFLDLAPRRRKGKGKGKASSGSYFDDLRALKELIEEKPAFPPQPNGEHADGATERIVSAGLERIEARGRYLSRREGIRLLNAALYVVILMGVAIAVWVIALDGNPVNVVSHLPGL